ncbi:MULTISPECIES: DNA primase [Sutcliffiella]|uniref:DNA primase n=1 Tax=Sutcliffiella TaxID=2837511 RepID=UPI0022DCF104|nr:MULTISPECIES: DNA primase [Sutcliffiella]MED4016504.1 DNA primase [Sutcliffiella cohnii]WBL13845.1 DNA primase [Sutcliffiella sp. NC1]
MTIRIPENTIEQIRQSTDIVEVISEYVSLKKQGRNFFGLCPFHGESTPSFSVSPDKQIFHCFGCGAGGNAFNFIMDIEGISFVEAAQKLAKVSNVEIEQDVQLTSNETSANSTEKSQMTNAHMLLQKFYHHLLLNTKEGQHAYDYLTSRDFTDDTIKKFGIGYSLNSWDFALKFLTKRGFKESLLEKAGLLIEKEEKFEYFDRFRDRIMFPIYDHKGNLIAFSGRVLGKGEPKYLNSPETIIFNKSQVLYNFHQARSHIRKEQKVILFEGFADVIAADRAGVFHSIATMGTSLTDDQARIIRRNVENVTICYDGDNAGVEAAFRAANLLTKHGCTIRIATLPDGLDPDDYIRKKGPESFKDDVLGASLTFMAFKLKYFRKGKDLNDEGVKMNYIDSVLQEISYLHNAVERDHYLRQLSSEFSLSLEALKEQLQKFSKKNSKNQEKEDITIKKPVSKVVLSHKLRPAYENAERFLLAHMLRNRDISDKVQDQIQGSFNIEQHKAIAAYLYAFYEEGFEPNISLLLERITDENIKRLVSELAMLTVEDEVNDVVLNDYIKQVLNYPKMLTIKEKEIEKQQAEQKKDIMKAAQIAMEIIQLKKLLKQ